eukprot:TRINITY_DN19179_c0_g1_i2.p1 TRINITY_DN19179_c0_g1~~TRINITY_DN19179_c0_g1_i2.p1  ORF type:complete len:486 (-),score=96.77 TRINITY_DN19179_c0_g1_i2:1004-2374(-)
MEALLDGGASFELSKGLLDDWFDEHWEDFRMNLHKLQVEAFESAKSDAEAEIAFKEAVNEQMKVRANQVIIETAFKKIAHPKLVVSFIIYFVYLLMSTLWVVQETNQDKVAAPYLRMAVENAFTSQTFNFADSPFPKTFMDINNIQDFWAWARGPFLDGMYPDDGNLGFFYEGNNLTNSGYGFLYGTTKVLGSPRFRQVRSQRIPCYPSDYGGTLRSCFSQDLTNYEETGAFGPHYNWTWKSATELDNPSLWGQYGFIPGSGYIVDFPAVVNSSSRALASDLIDDLTNNSWIDLKTRFVSVDFPIYSPAESQFAWISLYVEFPTVGSTIPTADIAVNRLRRYVSPADTFAWFLEVCMAFSMIVWTFHNGVKLYCFGRDYLLGFYSWCFFLILFLYLTAMSLHLRGWALEKKIDWNTTQSFVNLAWMSYACTSTGFDVTCLQQTHSHGSWKFVWPFQ